MTYIYIYIEKKYVYNLSRNFNFNIRAARNRESNGTFKIYLLKNRHLEQLVPRTRSNIVVITNPNDRRRNNRHS